MAISKPTTNNQKSPITACIRDVTGFVPHDVLSNKELEKMVDTNDEWIKTRTGIHERRILKGEGKGTSDMIVPTVNNLLNNCQVRPEEIDLVIVATITPDRMLPATAMHVAKRCGLINAFGFDINAACSGFLYGLETARRFVESGSYKNVIVIGADKMSSIIDYQDRNTCIIFGDGAGAALLQPSTNGFGIQDAILKADGSGVELLYQHAGGSAYPPNQETVANREHFIYQDGKQVFKAAVQAMSGVCQDILDRNSLTGDDIDWLVPHQANIRIIDATRERMGLPREKTMINIHKYGNTTAGTLPLCLWEYKDQLKPGDRLLLTAFGGGFTWGAIILTWGC